MRATSLEKLVLLHLMFNILDKAINCLKSLNQIKALRKYVLNIIMVQQFFWILLFLGHQGSYQLVDATPIFDFGGFCTVRNVGCESDLESLFFDVSTFYGPWSGPFWST